MPLTPLDDAALVVVDLQNATVGLLPEDTATTVVENVGRLVAAFRRTGRVVVVATADLEHPPPGRTTHDRPPAALPPDALALVPGLAPEPDDVVVTRSGWSVFTATDLDQQLRARGVARVVLVGLATEFGVESSARSAFDLGYDVLVVSDATASPVPGGHQHSLASVVPALGLVATAAEVEARLG